MQLLRQARAARSNGSLRRRRKELDGYRKHPEKEREAPILYCGHTTGEEKLLFSSTTATAVEDSKITHEVKREHKDARDKPPIFGPLSTPEADSMRLALPPPKFSSKYGEVSIQGQLTLRKHEAKADTRSLSEGSSAPSFTRKPLDEDLAAEDALHCLEGTTIQ
ncbi:hypothetical protein PG985_003734 [Apiospora marii]|uniref:Uncharacterized protein n=1 Tax=Apiospora marii TaxID=335849 RepID=A0ABR1SH97_9PEZI